VDVPVAVAAAQAVDALAALRHVAHAGAHAPPAVHAAAHLVDIYTYVYIYIIYHTASIHD
jgi:hypothetical protein